MNARRIELCLGLVLVLLSATNSAAQPRGFQVDQARRSVVYIKSFIPNVGAGVGTGFLVSDDGLIYTNRHVIESGNRSHKKSVILVGVSSKDDPDNLDYFPAKVVHVVDEPPSRDFAILKIVAEPGYGKFAPLRLATDGLALGQDVSVLGFPYIQEGEPTISFTRGTVSSTKVNFDNVAFYQTDAAVNSGNSGGPLLNSAGEVAGIVTLKISGADNIGYALHLSEILPEVAKAEANIAAVKPDRGPLAKEDLPDLEKLAEADSEAGSGTEARTPDWAKPKPFDPINRIWTSAGGQFSIEATYVTSKDDQVTLRKPNGAIIKVDVSKLSELDQYYVHAIESPWKREGRLPAPPPSVVKAKTDEVRRVFEGEFETGGEALFSKLLQLALDTRAQDPAAAYVCLWESSRMAAQAAQIDLMFITLAGLERWYEIDSQLLPMQVEVLSIAADKLRSNVQRAEALSYAVALIGFAIERHDVESGQSLVTLSLTLTRRLRSGEVLKIVRGATVRFEAFREAYQLAEDARSQLKTDPADAAAHLAIGRLMCVFDNDWTEECLEHLTSCSDAALAAAAQAELANPTTPKSQLAVADAWWRLAEDRGQFDQEALQAHAAEWYQRCLPKLSALDRTKAEQRASRWSTKRKEGRSPATQDPSPSGEVSRSRADRAGLPFWTPPTRGRREMV